MMRLEHLPSLAKNMKKYIIGIIVALLVGLVIGFTFVRQPTTVVKGTTNVSSLGTESLSVGTGCDNSFSTCTGTTIDASGNIVILGKTTFDGGTIYSSTLSTTTGTAVTLKQSDLLTYTTILALPIVGATTWTLPASSTMASYVPVAGDTQRVTIVNASTTAGITLTLAAGTGWNINSATTTLQIRPNTSAVLNCTRKAATASTFDINCLFLNGY
jgi:hypothetical protein